MGENEASTFDYDIFDKDEETLFKRYDKFETIGDGKEWLEASLIAVLTNISYNQSNHNLPSIVTLQRFFNIVIITGQDIYFSRMIGDNVIINVRKSIHQNLPEHSIITNQID